MGKVLAEPEIFSLGYLPPKLQGREELVYKIIRHVSSPIKQNILLYGKTGTGKTAIVRYALSRLEQCNNTHTAYVGCFKTKTAYSIFDHLLQDLRILRAETRSTDYKARRLAEAMKGRFLVVALDEIDRLPLGEMELVLHELSEIKNIAIICVGEDKLALAALNPSIGSRVSPVILEACEYTKSQLGEILAERAEAGLDSGSWNQNILNEIALASSGNARVAIQTMRSAAHIAECEGQSVLKSHHVQEGIIAAQHIRREYKLNSLTPHHQLLYQVIKEEKNKCLFELEIGFRARCIERGLKPVSRRSFYRFSEALRKVKLVRGRKTMTFGLKTTVEAID
jgi:Cdc6-like AAA superfamily ATPase